MTNNFKESWLGKLSSIVLAYDSAVSERLWKQTKGDKLSPSFIVPLTLKSSLRYGENPHQKAAFYTTVACLKLMVMVLRHLSNTTGRKCLIIIIWMLMQLGTVFVTCVVVKHTNPCGVASHDDLIEAYRLAAKADPVSAIGDIVAFNTEVDELGCVLVEYKRTEASTIAAHCLHGRNFDGRTVSVEYVAPDAYFMRFHK